MTSIPTRQIQLEVVTDTLDGLHAAIEGGADRIELVMGLAFGGLTPAVGLLERAALSPVPVRAMIRPRTADFTYSDAEVAMMRSDIDAVSRIGVRGVVFGANLPSGELDRDKLARLSEPAQARGLDVAMHRGFDLAPDPLAAIDICISLGISTVLTSGGPRFAEDGIQGLKHYVAHAAGRIEIMAGSGVTANNATRVVEGSGVNWIHASCLGSCTVEGDQPPPDRVAALGGLTQTRKVTDSRVVRQLRSVLDEMSLSRKNHR